ncbi:MAG: Omp28-related outer membrane protein [Bacteroidetes bacterium]|nr:Omp28-related outer membrane protein [Bacteroidota bacterium]MCW5896227.1 Omp28-related outer membrane protein [Bacteroidota bacterium]
MKKLSLLLAVVILLSGFTATGDAAARKVLFEMITSTTCAPCYPADVFYFQNWLPNYGGAASVVTLAYHVWWPTPGNDPMYLANTAPVQTRMNYYAPSGNFAPRAFIDGFIDGGSGYSSWPGAIEGRWLDFSPINIVVTGTRNGNTLEMNAAITAEQNVNSANWRVHWAVVESEIPEPQNSGSGYVPFIHHFVHRNMYPDANGSPISISQGQTVNVPRTITLNSNWNATHCRVIVFVQDNANKKVQNVEYMEVPDIPTSVGNPSNDIPTTFAISQNYPNPFNPTTQFDYAVSSRSFISITVYDLLGREVKSLVSDEKAAGVYKAEWDGTDNAGTVLPSGMYLYRMTAGNFSETRKMILMK